MIITTDEECDVAWAEWKVLNDKLPFLEPSSERQLELDVAIDDYQKKKLAKQIGNEILFELISRPDPLA